MPQSVVRFIQFAHPENPPPFAASAFAAVTFASSGLLNTVLYAYTRPSLLPHDPEDDLTADEKGPPTGGLNTEFQTVDYEASVGSHSRPVSMHTSHGVESSRNSNHGQSDRRNSSVPGAGGLED
jgi:hypothetical protein